MNRPFLTDLDSRAAVKGSRDPLGIQPIWGRFGRHVVGNLSTVSNSARDFTLTVLGYHFAEQVAEIQGPGTELATFLKWEQLAGYARAKVNQETGFRGTERVWKNLEAGSVTLGAEPRHQILSSQKLYGLWGLFTVPSRSSGLLDGSPARLTPPARELVEELYLPQLAKAGFKDSKRIVELLAPEKVKIEVNGTHGKLLHAIAGLILPKFSARERNFYRDHLLYGGPQDATAGRQRQLVEILTPKLNESEFPWSPPAVIGLAKEAETRGETGHALGGRLLRIAAAETLVAPASMLFIHLLGCDRVTVEELAGRIRQQWGARMNTVKLAALEPLQTELGGDDPAVGQRWLAVAQAMAEGDYRQLIRLLIAQNRAVMQQRGGLCAWIEEQNGELKVRMPEERGELPAGSVLPTLWRFPYFLTALAAVTHQIEGKPHG